MVPLRAYEKKKPYETPLCCRYCQKSNTCLSLSLKCSDELLEQLSTASLVTLFKQNWYYVQHLHIVMHLLPMKGSTLLSAPLPLLRHGIEASDASVTSIGNIWQCAFAFRVFCHSFYCFIVRRLSSAGHGSERSFTKVSSLHCRSHLARDHTPCTI